jgi:hypothetical protein
MGDDLPLTVTSILRHGANRHPDPPENPNPPDKSAPAMPAAYWYQLRVVKLT